MHTNTSQPEWLKNLITTLGNQSGIKPSDLHQAAQNLRMLQAYEPVSCTSLEPVRHLFTRKVLENLAPLVDKEDTFRLARFCAEAATFHEKEAAPRAERNTRFATVNTAMLESHSSKVQKIIKSCRHAVNVARRKADDELDACAAELARAECTHNIIGAVYWCSLRNNFNPVAFGNFVSAVRRAHMAHALAEAYKRNGKVRASHTEQEAGRKSDAFMLEALVSLLPPATAEKETIAA